MAKKTTTEVLEIDAGAVLDALRRAGWSIDPGAADVTVVDNLGATMPGAFGSLRFTFESETTVNLKREV
jgi:hypothetical protein